MTGNTVNLGIGFGVRGVAVDVARGVALASFVAGVAAGVLVAEVAARRASARALAVTVGAEVLLLWAFLLWGASLWRGGALRLRSSAELYGLVALAAAAMGMQAAAVRRVRGQTVRTVYITGVLTRATEEGVRLAWWHHDRAHGVARPPWRNEPTPHRLGLLGGIYASWLGAAVLGSFALDRIGIWVLAIPTALLAAIVVADVVVAGEPPSR